MIKKILLFTFIFSTLIACSKKNVIERNAFDTHKYQAEFVNIIITPAATNFKTAAENLQKAILLFSTTVNKQNLTAVKKAWKTVAIAYSENEVGNLGDIKNTSIHLAIYNWDANETAIEDYIASNKSISETTINSLPTKTRGLSAIEYLIFEEDAAKTITRFSSKRRVSYLTSLGKNLVIKATSLKKQWEDYSAAFINNTSTGLDGSINMVVNQMNVLLENIRRFKVGGPAGLENSTVLNVDLLQADKSGISLNIIEKNISTLKATYFGNNYGLDDYVSLITGNEDVNTAIKKQFIAIESNIATLSNTTLKAAIIAKNPQVNALYKNLRDLIVLVKVDVASIVSITVTFTDNDGD
ncbi:MAG: imelysin family protein [Polaribacter sp.]